jgi:hypothetical protein
MVWSLIFIEAVLLLIFLLIFWYKIFQKKKESLLKVGMYLFGIIFIELIIFILYQNKAFNNGEPNVYIKDITNIILISIIGIQFIIIDIYILIQSGKRLMSGDYKNEKSFSKRISYLIINLLFVLVISHILFGYIFMLISSVFTPVHLNYFTKFYSPFYVSLAIIHSLPLRDGFNSFVNESEGISLFVSFHTFFFKIIEWVSVGYIITLIIEELQTENKKEYLSSRPIKNGKIETIIKKLKEKQKISYKEVIEIEIYINQLKDNNKQN